MSASTPGTLPGSALDLSKFDDRRGHFWEMLRGRVSRGPASEMLGWKVLEIDPEAGRIKVEYDAKPEFMNPLGMIHGGFVAAMLDDVMGPALICTHEPGKANPTIEMKVSYHRPARVGRIIGVGQVLQKGKTIGFVEGKLYDPEGQLIASASGTFRIISKDLSAERTDAPPPR